MSVPEPEATEADYRVPVDGHGAVIVRAADPDEAFETAREQATPAEADMNVSIGDSYRERVRQVDDPDRDPINVEVESEPEVSIPEVPVPEQLAVARKELGLTQRDIADEMGVSPKTVSHYETGAREMSLERAADYADALYTLRSEL